VRSLVNNVQAIKNALIGVKRLKQDLDATASLLQTLGAGPNTSLQHLSIDANAALVVALENCKSVDKMESYVSKETIAKAWESTLLTRS